MFVETPRNIYLFQHPYKSTFFHAAIFQSVFPMYALTRIQETVHAKNVSQSPSPSKEAARIVSNSKWIPLETRSAVEFRNRSAKDGSVPRGQLTRGNSRPLLVGGHGITDATCVESGISYWAAGFWAALQTGFLQPDSIMLIAYMHVSIWLIRWRVGSPFTSLLSRCVRARVYPFRWSSGALEKPWSRPPFNAGPTFRQLDTFHRA